MNRFRIPLFFTATIYGIYWLLTYIFDNDIIPALIFLIPILVLIINLVLRKKLKYKNWFLSKWNILLDKKSFQLETDISNDLLFAKIQEVIAESHFKLLDVNETSVDFLLGTSVSFWTWGENIYISVEQNGTSSKIKVTSVTIFGSFSWGKNDTHFKNFSEAFEQSLTI